MASLTCPPNPGFNPGKADAAAHADAHVLRPFIAGAAEIADAQDDDLPPSLKLRRTSAFARGSVLLRRMCVFPLSLAERGLGVRSVKLPRRCRMNLCAKLQTPRVCFRPSSPFSVSIAVRSIGLRPTTPNPSPQGRRGVSARRGSARACGIRLPPDLIRGSADKKC